MTRTPEWRICLGAILLLGLWLRLWHLWLPSEMVFDEIHYVRSASALLTGQPDNVPMVPPMGKLLIAASMEMYWGLERYMLQAWQPLGTSTMAWRFGSVLCGVAMIAMTATLGLDLFRRRRVALLAAFLLAIDLLHIVFSRLAQLDVYHSCFLLAGFLFTWRYIEAGDRPLRHVLSASLAFAVGTAIKWGGLFAILAALLSIALLKAYPSGKARHRDLWRIVGIGLLTCLIVYTMSYLPIYARNQGDIAATAREVAHDHQLMWTLRRSSTPRHGGAWWEWPLLLHPLQLYKFNAFAPWPLQVYQDEPDLPLMKILAGDVPQNRLRWLGAIYAIGSPWVWGWFLICLGSACPAVVRIIRRRDLQEDDRAVTFCVLVYLLQLAAWQINFGYMYYMMPLTPFIGLLVAWRVARAGAVAMTCFVAGALATLLVYWPILVAYPLPQPYFERILFYRGGKPWFGLI